MRILFLLYIFSTFAQAYESSILKGRPAMVTVMEAPLLRKPNMKSLVLDKIRKGDIIHVRGRNVGLSTHEISYNSGFEKAYFPTDEEGNEYFESVDKMGNTVYIPREYLRVIHQDEGEAERRPRLSKDHTDYRIYSPITDEYPFYPFERYKLYWFYGIGSTHQANYTYPRKVIRESITTRQQGELGFFKKVSFDGLDRFYYGGVMHLFADEGEYFLEDDIVARELRGQFGIGPALSYEYFKRDDIGITFFGGITVTYDRLFIKQKEPDGTSEERTFHGFNLTPKLGTYIQFKEALPFADLMVGANMQFNYKYEINATSKPELEDLWHETNDNYNYPTGGIYTIFLGTVSTL